MNKVLIIEDESSIAELQRDYFEASGYEIELEFSGRAGLENALKNHYNLIILDIMLPDMDGFNICKEIRKEKQVPIMFVSAKIDEIDKIRGLSLGADDYIVKPFSPYELLARASAHIKRYENLTAYNAAPQTGLSEICIRGLRINASSHCVFVYEKEVSLSNKEFDLLYFLMQNPDCVFGKEKILNEVWGPDAFVEPGTVAVHINRLREKIEKEPSSPEYIQTVWGVGYKFTI